MESILVLRSAVARCMRIISEFQRNTKMPHETRVKADTTLVTRADRLSEHAALEVLRNWPHVALWSEESGRHMETSGAEYLALLDPLDGTRAFSVGLHTSTVIAGLYSLQSARVIACVVGEPGSGRLWSAAHDQQTLLQHIDYGAKLAEFSPALPVQVGDEQSSLQSTVFMDACRETRRQGNVVWRVDQVQRVMGALSSRMRLLMPGSIGLHHALVANGQGGVAGCVTLGAGGPWDLCSVLLVLQAGGCARGFSRGEHGTLVECDPLDALSLNALIAANCENKLGELTDMVVRALGPQ